jgi:hypothetical protein
MLVPKIELGEGESDIGRRETLPACVLEASHAVKESTDAEPATAGLGLTLHPPRGSIEF